MMNSKLIKLSHKLARLLRHEGPIDPHAWMEVSYLIQHKGFTLEQLQAIVRENNKQRFEFSDDMTRIRARQGHSLAVDAELDVQTPPAVLYHGTAKDSVDSILAEGITPQGRIYVHLTDSVQMAISVGRRHGEPVVLRIDSERMNCEGITFYKSRNNVWLTDFVAPQFVSIENCIAEI